LLAAFPASGIQPQIYLSKLTNRQDGHTREPFFRPSRPGSALVPTGAVAHSNPPNDLSQWDFLPF